MSQRYFVPLVTVNIQPAKDADRPGIELTTRSAQVPVYEVPLIKARWGRRAERVDVRPMLEDKNPLFELHGRNGMDPIASEELRLTQKYTQPIFQAVYRTSDLAEQIEKHAKSSNDYLEKVKERDAELAMVGAEKAAEALVRESAKAVAKAESKRGPGRPRKVTQEPAPADA